MSQPVYLDYNATTPVDPRVAEVIAAALRDAWGNPSSIHAYGEKAHELLDRARGQVAALLGCPPDEVVFTAGGSEADNLAIKGVAFANRERGKHLVTSAVEHPAVLNACRWLVERLGYELTLLPVGVDGRVDPDDLAGAIRPDTALVTLMHANNEVGSLNPVDDLRRVCADCGVTFHTDAAQSVGKVAAPAADLVTVVGHKMYAPKGIGALRVREGTRLDSLVHGAGHERGRRAGTENVAFAAGLGRAAETCGGSLDAEAARLRALRDRLHERLAAHVPGLALNGHATERLPNTLNVSFPRVDGHELLLRAPAVAASTGSACHAGRTEPSAVLLAMGMEAARAFGAVRLSLGRWSTEEEVVLAADALTTAWRQLS